MAPSIQPAKSPIGPPAPAYFQWLARITMICLVAVVGHWVQKELGGVAMAPKSNEDGSNDTSGVFNWHPVLMTLAFGVFMAEAVLTYQAPIISSLSRPLRKKLHVALQSLATLCALLGALAAFKSHSLKLPVPIPDLYSPHSFLGLFVLFLLSLQCVAGFGSYLWPQISLPSRLALGPIHKFAGKLVWVAALAAIATGLQEKTTFIQTGKQLSGAALYSPIIRLPAFAMLLLVLLAALVLFHQVPMAKALEEDRVRLLSGNEAEA